MQSVVISLRLRQSQESSDGRWVTSVDNVEGQLIFVTLVGKTCLPRSVAMFFGVETCHKPTAIGHTEKTRWHIEDTTNYPFLPVLIYYKYDTISFLPLHTACYIYMSCFPCVEQISNK